MNFARVLDREGSRLRGRDEVSRKFSERHEKSPIMKLKTSKTRVIIKKSVGRVTMPTGTL